MKNNPTLQRQEMAEYCGARWHWTHDRKMIFITFDSHDGCLVENEKSISWMKRSGDCAFGLSIPDYGRSLDLMRKEEEQIKIRRPETYLKYKGILFTIERDYIHATAAQRLEAFLKAVGRWVD